MAVPKPLSPIHRLSTEITNFLKNFSPGSPRFGLLILLYSVCVFSISAVEKRIFTHVPDTTTPVDMRLPAIRATYSLPELADFLDRIGARGRAWFAGYLLLEIPSLIVWTVFAALIVSAITIPLVNAEQELNQPGETTQPVKPDGAQTESFTQSQKTDPAPEPSMPMLPATLLNTLPLLFALFQLVETTFLLLSIQQYSVLGWSPDSLLTLVVALTPGITKWKWIATRLLGVFTIITIVTGWARVFITRMRMGKPLLGPPTPKFVPPTMPPGTRLVPRGLTPASMISEKTWKPEGGRKNNKKKK
ncbi:hypothetical protein DFJ77DRAFT_304568 [Powellomyces hirtus]|nr:hypothetical protein DFJ77DRAFT_304568 [Powellomyces hirtus]